jgi:PAS domain S-box-containing protein
VQLARRLEEGTMTQTRSKKHKIDADEASNAIEERLRLILDTIPTIVWRKFPDGSADFLNKYFGEYTGLSLESGMGWGWMEAFHPDDRLIEEWRAALAGGKPFEKEARLRRADGEYRWFLLRAVPLRGEQGNIVKWYGTTSDIEHLKRAEDHIRLIIDTIPTMAWSIRPDGTVDFVNQRWLDYTGISLEEEIEEPTRAVHPEDLPRVMEKWLADMAAGQPSEDEMRLRGADGKYRWFLVRTAPLRDEHGKLVKWYGLSIDIEDRKQMEGELRHLSGQLLRSQDEERRRIARDLHDSMAQNLIALATSLDQLRGSIPSLTGKSRNLISEAIELADQCIREARTLSYVLHPPMLDEAGLEDAIRHYVKGFTERSGIQVDLEVSRTVERMPRDIELALFRVVQESLTNIHRHSGSPEAKIRIDRDPDHLTLVVSDRGHGVSGDGLKRDGGPRFELGVGIPSMQERVKLIGGRLDIDSTSSGTTVRVTIPFGAHRHEEATHSDS